MSRELGGALKKFLGSKVHLDWLKIDLNAANIMTVQDKKLMCMELCIYSVNTKSEAGKI